MLYISEVVLCNLVVQGVVCVGDGAPRFVGRADINYDSSNCCIDSVCLPASLLSSRGWQYVLHLFVGIGGAQRMEERAARESHALWWLCSQRRPLNRSLLYGEAADFRDVVRTE
jgi:hypothetical protein